MKKNLKKNSLNTQMFNETLSTQFVTRGESCTVTVTTCKLNKCKTLMIRMVSCSNITKHIQYTPCSTNIVFNTFGYKVINNYITLQLIYITLIKYIIYYLVIEQIESQKTC